MKYIIMAGGDYPWLKCQKQLFRIAGETIIERTIRLLKAEGVTNIAISTNKAVFDNLGLPIIRQEKADCTKWIVGAFPMLNEPVCYIYGDVIYSPFAIKEIVNTDTDDIQFFASAEPFDKAYIKPFAEPFAYKVVNTEHFKNAIDETLRLFETGILKRCISWELWQVIKGTEPNKIITNYHVVNDYTCDADSERDLLRFMNRLTELGIDLFKEANK